MQPTACKLSLKIAKNDNINSPLDGRQINNTPHEPYHSTSSAVFYYWLLRLQIYRCVQLFCSLRCGRSSMLQVAINNIHWWVDRRWSIVTCTSSSHRSIRSVNLLIARAFTPDSGWESRLSLPYLHSTPPLAGPRLNIAITFGVENYTVSQKV